MKSFTLAELLVSVAILVILMLGAFQVMDVGTKSWFTGDVAVQLRQEIVKIFMKMEVELKKTRPSQISLAAGISSNALTFKVPQDNDNDGAILDSSGNIEWSGDIVYALNGSGQITRTSTSSTTIIANNVLSLQFTRPVSPANILQIDIVVRKTAASGRSIQDAAQLKVKMRN